VEGETLADMIREDLIAERIVIEVYQEMIRFFGNNDPTTRVILEKLLHDEEEHADDLSDLLYIVNPETAKTEGQDPGTEPLRLHGEQQTTQEIADKRNRATERSNARHAAGQEGRELQGRTKQPEPGSEEAHKRDRDRILNELRWMGKNKKKPAA